MFSFDVFGGNESLGIKLLGFLVHNIPVLILVGILIIAWKWEMAGGALLCWLSMWRCFFSFFLRKSRFTYCYCSISAYRPAVYPPSCSLSCSQKDRFYMIYWGNF